MTSNEPWGLYPHPACAYDRSAFRYAVSFLGGPSSTSAAKIPAPFGLPVLKPYETLRHSTATEWLRRGATEREVQELLGHRSAHATPWYARLADRRLEEIVGRREQRDRGDGDRRS